MVCDLVSAFILASAGPGAYWVDRWMVFVPLFRKVIMYDPKQQESQLRKVVHGMCCRQDVRCKRQARRFTNGGGGFGRSWTQRVTIELASSDSSGFKPIDTAWGTPVGYVQYKSSNAETDQP